MLDAEPFRFSVKSLTSRQTIKTVRRRLIGLDQISCRSRWRRRRTLPDHDGEGGESAFTVSAGSKSITYSMLTWRMSENIKSKKRNDINNTTMQKREMDGNSNPNVMETNQSQSFELLIGRRRIQPNFFARIEGNLNNMFHSSSPSSCRYDDTDQFSLETCSPGMAVILPMLRECTAAHDRRPCHPSRTERAENRTSISNLQQRSGRDRLSRSPSDWIGVLLALAHGERLGIILHCEQWRFAKDQSVRKSVAITISRRSKLSSFQSLLRFVSSVKHSTRQRWWCENPLWMWSSWWNRSIGIYHHWKWYSVSSVSLRSMECWSRSRLVPSEPGVGTSLSLFHVLHYGFRKKMLLVNTPTGEWIELFHTAHLQFFSSAMEVVKLVLDATPSPSNELMWDTPAAATAWLKTFAINNETLLKETDVQNWCRSAVETCFCLSLVSHEIHSYLECARSDTGWHSSSRLDCLRKYRDQGNVISLMEWFRPLNASSMLRDVLERLSRKSKLKWGRKSKSDTEKTPCFYLFSFSIQTLVTFDTINSYFGPTWIVKPDRSTVGSNALAAFSPITEVNAFVSRRSNQMKWQWSMPCRNCYFPTGTMPSLWWPSDRRVFWSPKSVRSATGSFDMAITARRIVYPVFWCTMDPPRWNRYWELKWVSLHTIEHDWTFLFAGRGSTGALRTDWSGQIHRNGVQHSVSILRRSQLDTKLSGSRGRRPKGNPVLHRSKSLRNGQVCRFSLIACVYTDQERERERKRSMPVWKIFQ